MAGTPLTNVDDSLSRQRAVPVQRQTRLPRGNVRFDPWKLLLHAVLITVGLLYLLPFIWMLATSLKGPTEMFSPTPNLIPKAWRWQNYVEAFDQVPFARFYFNSVFVTFTRVLGQVVFAAAAGFAFARLRFPGRNILFFLILAVMMVPGQVTLVPNYVLLRDLGWLDSYQGLIVPSLFSAFGTFLMRQFFLSMPQDLLDAASIDGCNPLQTFSFIALPLARTVLVAFGVLVTLWSWNDLLWPLIITKSTDMQLLSVGIAYFQGQFVSNYAVMMAAATLSTIPMIILFVVAQRFLIEGITMSGLKL
jgi:multiple sugar transport system permease protein